MAPHHVGRRDQESGGQRRDLTGQGRAQPAAAYPRTAARARGHGRLVDALRAQLDAERTGQQRVGRWQQGISAGGQARHAGFDRHLPPHGGTASARVRGDRRLAAPKARHDGVDRIARAAESEPRIGVGHGRRPSIRRRRTGPAQRPRPPRSPCPGC
ncbi:hypothetical protein G6F46_014448 [Rhizopus delemar]|nr:hypothetical protein G6F46_014448 [Rhizopus delemar]